MEYKQLKYMRECIQTLLPICLDNCFTEAEQIAKLTKGFNDIVNNDSYFKETLDAGIAEIKQYKEDTDQDIDVFKEFVTTYLKNLDVQDEINTKLDGLVKDGTIGDLISPLVTESLPPYVVDSTSDMTNNSRLYILSSTGHVWQYNQTSKSFTDTGLNMGAISNVIKTKIIISNGDLNEVTTDSVISMSYPPTGSGYINAPNITEGAYLFTYHYGDAGSANIQFLYPYSKNVGFWTRKSDINGNWTGWKYVNYDPPTDYLNVNDIITNGNINDVEPNTVIAISWPGEYTNYPLERGSYLFTYQYGVSDKARLQFLYGYDSKDVYTRQSDINGNWTEWEYSAGLKVNKIITEGNINDVEPNTVIAISWPGEYTNYPLERGSYLFTYQYGVSDKARLQFLYGYNSKDVYTRQSDINGNWTEWEKGAGGITQYVTNQTITNKTYQNTYNISSTPNITTDTNGWLKSTGDNTDMTGAIMTMLHETGYCHLGEGDFYVNGQIEMPENSTLIGCGFKSKLKVLGGYEGTVIIPTDYCTVKNLHIVGGGTPSENITGDCGIVIYDTKVDFESESTHGFRNCLIDGVKISNFGGSGIEIRGTGGSLQWGSIVTNCTIETCSVGIHLGKFSEYHKIDSCILSPSNYIGIINNGGNNSFVNCTITGSNSGFVIDNSKNDLINEGHGSCVGCCFNHAGNNRGDAIRLIGLRYGFLVSSCEWWYGNLVVNNCTGVSFNGIQGCGTPSTITVSSSNGVMFSNMLLNYTPTITVSETTNITSTNNYNSTSGEEIVIK